MVLLPEPALVFTEFFMQLVIGPLIVWIFLFEISALIWFRVVGLSVRMCTYNVFDLLDKMVFLLLLTVRWLVVVPTGMLIEQLTLSIDGLGRVHVFEFII